MDIGCLHRGMDVPRIDIHSKGELYVLVVKNMMA